MSDLLNKQNDFIIIDDESYINYNGFINYCDLYDLLEECLEEIIYGYGLDNYILKNSFSNREEYQKLETEYDFLFNTTTIEDANVLKTSFDYFIETYKDYDIYYYNSGILHTINGDNYIDKISEIVNLNLDNLKENNKYLIKFVDYYLNKKNELSLNKKKE